MNKLTTAGLLAALAVVALPAATANAEGTSGTCEASGYYANFSLIYHNSGSYHYPDQYSWTIGRGQNDIGTHNNVEARVKTVNPGGDDRVYHTYISPDSVKAGHSTSNIPNSVKVPRNDSMYGAFRFVFDKPDDGDPRCTGRTTSV